MNFSERIIGLLLTYYLGILPIANLILKTLLWIMALSLFFARHRLIHWRVWKRIQELKELNKNLIS
jgi:hypothetical protein